MKTDVQDAMREVHDIMELLADFLSQVQQNSDDPMKNELIQLSTALRLLVHGNTSAMRISVDGSTCQLH